ncbi:MAG: glucose-6-phosphate isomerase [Planctomycetales bacterium]|nr:glucose-6-phosphate isomerase [Planctomycetales bacterium]
MSTPLISYDPSGALFTPGGVSREAVEALAEALLSARDETLADAQLWADGVEPADHKKPLDAGFHNLPERLLAEVASCGDQSEVRRIQAAADRLAARCDSVVVLGIGGSYMGARALLEACCHPFYNELSSEQRQGRPRIYFEGNNVDNDSMTGLLELLQRDKGRWGIVVISKSGGTLETAAAFRIMVDALRAALPAEANLGDYIVPVTGPDSKLDRLAQALGVAADASFPVPDGVGGRFSVLSAVGLLPAALMGLDIEALLRGAEVMNDHFASQPPGSNVPLDYTGVCHAAERDAGCHIRIMSTWGKRLEALGLWYDQLLSESLGKEERGALPLTVVNTRDLHSRGQQHQQGRRDKIITNVIVDQASAAPIALGSSEYNQDGLNELADKTLPDILSAAVAGTNQAYAADQRPTTDLHLPQLNEYVMGQTLQMFMLATVLEGRLIGINPYGQPGVEDYKRNMNAILRGQSV